ncbi:MAG TPA: SPOR domain-containing protein [Terriglobales bacterium]|nr:SPOR domain-containing protein [Terriglobales bacterium]
MLDEQQQDTEFTLGAGKLLGLFFLLVILCGVFFALGYTVGRGSQKTEGSLIGGDKASAATQAPASASNGSVRPLTSEDKPQTDMSFYKAVEQKDADSKLEKAQPASTDDSKQNAPELQASPGGAYVVQVAAVTKKEDAEALQQALIKKQYPVVITPGGSDKLFHVQIGPFAELKDAETMKGRLANDGYNAIVKR